jgi:indole-3-glycerol phosphate synthase
LKVVLNFKYEMNILEEIVLQKRVEVELLKANTHIDWKQSPYFDLPCRSLKAVLQNRIGVIAEFKRMSPSLGIINDRVSPLEVALGYQEAGAVAVSILTDRAFFGGTLEDLLTVREKLQIPILRKDFMIDEIQLLEAKAKGADIILLIAACLSPTETKNMAQSAKQLGLEVLLEVHNLEELESHLNSFVDFVGVNNRNLKTFEVNIQTSLELAEKIPAEFVKISESGISKPDTVQELIAAGYQGFLMGEHFMKTNQPAKTCAAFIRAIAAV